MSSWLNSVLSDPSGYPARSTSLRSLPSTIYPSATDSDLPKGISPIESGTIPMAPEMDEKQHQEWKVNHAPSSSFDHAVENPVNLPIAVNDGLTAQTNESGSTSTWGSNPPPRPGVKKSWGPGAKKTSNKVTSKAWMVASEAKKAKAEAESEAKVKAAEEEAKAKAEEAKVAAAAQENRELAMAKEAAAARAWMAAEAAKKVEAEAEATAEADRERRAMVGQGEREVAEEKAATGWALRLAAGKAEAEAKEAEARAAELELSSIKTPLPLMSKRSDSSLNQVHRVFFPPDLDFITLKVEDTSFRIDCKLVQSSSYFMDLLEATNYEPITLRKVTADDMDCFLRLLDARILDPTPTFTSDELATLLRLGTMWDFPSIRSFAIKEIDNKLMTPPLDDPVDRIELAKKCSVDKWLEPAYLKLCTQPAAFTAQQMQRLAGLIGWPALAALADIRERSKICSKCTLTNLQNTAYPSRQHTAQQADQIKDLIKTLAIIKM